MDFLLRYGGRQAALRGLADDDLITKVISQTSGFYEQELLTEIFHRAMPGWIFVDAGAHVGNHSVFMGAILGLEGFSIEQNPETYKILKGNLAVNQLLGRVQSINAAVGSCAGKAQAIPNSDTHNSGMDRVEIADNGPIQVIALDSLKLTRLNLLKIDVEGFELECLKGARDTIARCTPLIVAEAISPQDFKAQCQFLYQFGYAPTRRYNVTPTYMYEKMRC